MTKLFKNSVAVLGVAALAYLLLIGGARELSGGKRYAVVNALQQFLGIAGQTKTANRVTAVVTRTTDGDTLHAKVNGRDETVRMLLIDTPEDQKPGTPTESFSREAAAYAARVMPVGASIKLQLGKAPDERDRYGRLLAYVYEPNGKLYENDCVRRGFARVAYVYKPNTDHLAQLLASQAYAKKNCLRIWSIPGYVTDNGYDASK